MPDAALAALFDALAAAQRGVPESMLKEASNPGVTNAEGVYTWLLMHTGDLVHRAAVADQPEWGVDAISGKVGQIKRVLDHGYGVGREVEEQIRGNYRHRAASGQALPPFDEFRREAAAAGERYAAAYEALRPVTLIQRLGRDAAVAVGRMDWDAARRLIDRLWELDRSDELVRLYHQPEEPGAEPPPGGPARLT
jgi:hypothetical protein